MARRKLTDEKRRAYKLYVYSNYTCAEIAKVLELHEQTVYRWATTGNWRKDREEVLITPDEISLPIKRFLLSFANDLVTKQRNHEAVSDTEFIRLERLVRTIERLDADYDLRGATIKAMDAFIEYLIKLNARDATDVLEKYLPAYYKQFEDHTKDDDDGKA